MMRTHRGLTLIELMVTVAIAAVLLAIAIPSFHDFFVTNRLSSATNDLVAALNTARSEAISRGVDVTLRRASATSKDWGSGWTMFVDTNGDGSQSGASEVTLKKGDAVSSQVSFKSNAHFADYISFTPTGDSQGQGANTAGTFVLCYDNSLVNARAVTVQDVAGRMTTCVNTNSNCKMDDGTTAISCSP